MSYVLEGSSWKSTPVTWSFAQNNYSYLSQIYSSYKNFDGAFSNYYKSTVESAFSAWTKVSGIVFSEVADSTSTDIRLGLANIDGYARPGGTSTLAYTMSWDNSGAFKVSEILFDVDSYTKSNGSPDLSILYETAVHEIGHAIGLGHSSSPSDVMYYLLNAQNAAGTLSTNDIAGARLLYGDVANSPPIVLNAVPDQAAKEGTSFHYVVPSNVFTDPNGDTLTESASWLYNGIATSLPSWLTFDGRTGTFSGVAPDGAPDLQIKLVANDGRGGEASTTFWIKTPAAVTTHPSTVPSDFSPLAYLAANTDLAKVFGIDLAAAAAHWLNYGYNESRSTTFDALQYLAVNTDLAKAFGANATLAEQHYILYGIKESRLTSGFDALAYLSANPDVNSAVAGNLTQALLHWINFGVKEGRGTGTQTVNISNTTAADSSPLAESDVVLVGVDAAHGAALGLIRFPYE